MSTAADAAPPGSPMARNRRVESPPPAPGPRRWNRKTRGGQVLLESVEIRLISGNLLAEVRGNESSLPDEFWYTGQLRTRIAALLGVEVCRLTLVDVKGNAVSDSECVIESPLTAIVGPQLEEPLAFEGNVALRA